MLQYLISQLVDAAQSAAHFSLYGFNNSNLKLVSVKPRHLYLCIVMPLHCGFTTSARFGFRWFCAQVKHLEVSCSSMAEDICRKSAIIETYVMDSRIGNPQPESDQEFGVCFPPICDSGSSFGFGSHGLFYQPAPQTGSYIWLLADEF